MILYGCCSRDGITAAIIFAAMHFTNAVHRTAGEDVGKYQGISGVFKEIAKTNGGSRCRTKRN